jgi:serine phosphatase RsbU (regulator of sigma subunit)
VPSETRIGDGWTLLLYSDGIYEGRVAGQNDRLGIDGFLGVLSEGRGSGASEFDPERLIDRVEELNRGPLDDDVALLALKRDVGTG